MNQQRCLSRLRRPVMVCALLLTTAFVSYVDDDQLRKPVSKGAYEMAYSEKPNGL